jgi:hypothetical protein
MSLEAVDEAFSRMRAALDRLETAVERRQRVDARRADADEEFALMQDDRSRLAVELDGALAGNRALAAANSAAAEKLARASATIETMLQQAGEGGD